MIEFDKYKESPEFKWKNSEISMEQFKFIWYMEYGHRYGIIDQQGWARGAKRYFKYYEVNEEKKNMSFVLYWGDICFFYMKKRIQNHFSLQYELIFSPKRPSPACLFTACVPNYLNSIFTFILIYLRKRYYFKANKVKKLL